MNKKNNFKKSSARGKFIVIYGVNNLGKTTQAKLLVKRLINQGYLAEYLKVPIYNLLPSGRILNNYLRKSNPDNLTPREAQIIYALNRTQYEIILREKLAHGINIIAEDYTGTGIAWGIGAGISDKFLKRINSHLLKEDLAFLFVGQRFKEAREKNHTHEINEQLMEKVKQAHFKLGCEYGWIKINANLNKRKVHEQIWKKVIKLINQ